jgi:hypothetical protein
MPRPRGRTKVEGVRTPATVSVSAGEPRFVWIWIKREDGAIEEHIGPIGRWLRGPDGKIVQRINPDTREVEAVADSEFARNVVKLVGEYDGQNARDVGKSLRKKDLAADETGALRKLATGLLSTAQRVTERQRRAEQKVLRTQIDGTVEEEPGMRAIWLADYELTRMTVHVRAE